MGVQVSQTCVCGHEYDEHDGGWDCEAEMDDGYHCGCLLYEPDEDTE